MHVKGMLSLGAALVVAVALVSASGAGTATSRSTTRIDVSTRAAVVHYLRAIHVNPRGVVIQRGARNYAGPNCPGKGWTCTSTAHAVVQVAPAGGKNDFQCSAAHCAVVQAAEAPAAPNTAKCVKTTGAMQSCSITQDNSNPDGNVAIVYQDVLKTTGLTQNASQTALITQFARGASGGNTACVNQTMLVNTSTVASKGMPVLATLDGHQTLTINQNSAHGANRADQSAVTTSGGLCDTNPLHDRMIQSQTISQTATGSAKITQLENTLGSGPNLDLDIEQNQSDGFGETSGTNKAAFSQDNVLTAIARTPNGPVIQTQSTANGGLQAKINQFSHAHSDASAKQTETQCEHAEASGPLTCDTPHPPSYQFTQTQFGPVKKGGCCSVQGDDPTDSFTVEQHTIQDNDSGNNQKNTMQADCQTSGGCTAHQDATIDGQPPTTNDQAGQNVNAETNCSGSSCTSFTVDGPQLSASNTNIAEFGFGGMRGNGTGSIAVGGVTGPVARALLYWNGPTNSADPAANAAVTFNGTPVTGTNIGVASDNCWSFQNSQSYQADVTGLVTGNGTYSLSNFNKPGVEINGVSLVVFYNDTDTSNDRNVTLWSGNDSNVGPGPGYAADGWDETLTGVQYQGGTATLDTIVSDGQVFEDDALVVNGFTIEPIGHIFEGDSVPAGPGPPPPDDVNGHLWDVKSFDITSALVGTSVHVTTGLDSDCLSLVVAAANVPASAPPIVAPSGEPRLPSRTRTQAAPPASVQGVPSGGAIVRK